jgi:hypothetical protein
MTCEAKRPCIRHLFARRFGHLPLGTIGICTAFPQAQPMPSVYFCQPHARNQGMLRAVLSLQECERVVSPQNVTYVGEQFPSVANSTTKDFAVIRFRPEETTRSWRPGYYRLDSDLSQLNESLLALSR